MNERPLLMTQLLDHESILTDGRPLLQFKQAKRPGFLGLLLWGCLLNSVSVLSLVGATDNLSIVKNKGSWDISYSQSLVTLQIPGVDEYQRMDFLAQLHPRYFYFISRHGISLSGWFEQSYRYKGLQDFWKSESARFYANPVTAPKDVIFGKCGKWEVVLYDMPLPKGGVDVHMRAEFSQGGTWIDMHLSEGTSPKNAASVRTQFTDFLEKVKVSVDPSAFVSPKELEAALADLTDRIEGVDDNGYRQACGVFTKYLLDLPSGKYPFNPAVRGWVSDKDTVPSAAVMLDIAFTASVVKDEINGVKEEQLYHAWLVVIKYYEHYVDPAMANGGVAWKKIPFIEDLVARKQNGTLREYSKTISIFKSALNSPKEGIKP
jgi:hypothetical protein